MGNIVDEITNQINQSTNVKNIEKDINTNIFKLNHTNCFKNSDVVIANCDHLKRMITALKYYKSLNIHSNPLNHDKFITFCNKIYKNIIDDYTHIISIHSHQLQQIHRQLTSNKTNVTDVCNVYGCNVTERHYDNRRNAKNSNTDQKYGMDSKIVFYADIFDIIHNFLYHLYDIGLRINIHEINIDENQNIENPDEHKEQNNGYFDLMLHKMKQLIKSKKKTFEKVINRFNKDSNKYN
eukprot:489856_1